MGRRKGDTYRKYKLKEIVRVACPTWTLPIDLIATVKYTAKEIGVHESRLVEMALKRILAPTALKLTNPAKIFPIN